MLIALFSSNVFALDIESNQTRKSLITVQNFDNDKGLHCSRIISMNFADGIFLSQDTLLTLNNLFQPLRASNMYGRNQTFIYKNRYLLTLDGLIIDLKLRKVIHNDKGMRFYHYQGDTVVLRKYIDDKINFYIVDLVDYSFEKDVDSTYQILEGDMSPDTTYSAEIVPKYSNQRFLSKADIFINFKDARRKLIAENINPYVESVPLPSYCWPKVEGLWFDNDNFVFADYSKSEKVYKGTLDNSDVLSSTDTSLLKIQIFRYTVSEGCTNLIYEIDSVHAGISPFGFYPSDYSEVLYFETGQRLYIVDTAAPVPGYKGDQYFGHDFYGNYESIDKTKFRVIYYQDQEIGTFSGWFQHISTTENHIAYTFTIHPKGRGIVRGINVWNSLSNQQYTIEIAGSFEIIGWIDSY
jgi:hypothetical protein